MVGAVVTGAAGGLGSRIAARLAARGYRVHVTDVDGDRAKAVAERIGSGAWGSALDVGDPEACGRVARATPALRVWVNNAGVLHTGPAWASTGAQRRTLLRVNAEGVVNGTLAALELMRPAGRGHVVNVVSLAGLVAAPGEALYSASKHAALAFSIGVQADLRPAGVTGVRVSALCPDGIWTPMLHDRVRDPHAAASWFGTLPAPDAVAAAAVRLLDACPTLSVRFAGAAMALGRRKQRRFAARRGRGKP